MKVTSNLREPETAVGHRAGLGRLAPTICLFFLAPLVGEFLLGNKPITSLPELVLLAPLYGGGAILIREVARRAGRGWPAMALLAAAYALLEEGPINQMLFNPAYLGLDSFRGLAPVPALGIGVSLIQHSLTQHTVWSICVPIAIIEAFGRDRTRPWLGKVGLALTGAVFAAGAFFLAFVQYEQFRFLASPAQFVVSSAVIAALTALAFGVRLRPAPRSDAAAPGPRVVGRAAFGVSSLYWIGWWFLPGWLSVGWWFVLAGAGVALLVRWSRLRGWGAAHVLAVAGGTLLTYVWVGFAQSQALGIPLGVAVLGNAVFGVGAIILLAAAVRVLKRRQGEDGRGSPPEKALS